MNSSTDRSQPVSEYQGNLEILMQISLFSGLPLEALKLLAYLCSREVFKPGEYVFQEGDIDPHAYFIIDGKALLSLPSEGGEAPVREFGENSFIGGLSLLCNAKRLFSLKVTSKMTCLVISKEKFTKTTEQFPEITGTIVQEVCNGIHQWESRIIGERSPDCAQCMAGLGISLA